MRLCREGRISYGLLDLVGPTLGSWSFYIWIHDGSQLTTALSEGRGYGEAGGEGFFSSCKISESLTHRFAVPPLPQAGEGYCQLIIRAQTKMDTLQRHD